MREKSTNLQNIIDESIEEIKQKLIHVCENSASFTLNYDTSSAFVSEVSGLVHNLGCHVIKSYFESRDEQAAQLFLEGKRYALKSASPKKVVTGLGTITLVRNYYQHRSGGKCIIPLDTKLGVKDELMMADVKEMVLFSSAHNTPNETSELLSKCSPIKLHPTQIKRAISSSGLLLEGKSTEIMQKVRAKEQAPDSELVAYSLDGVNVLLNQSGMKKGRPTERPTTQQAPTVSAYKNVMCGSVAHYRIEQQEQGLKKAARIATKYISNMPEDGYPTFKQAFEQEVKNHNTDGRVKLVITDAHKSIMGYLNNNPIFEGCHRIIDFFHASEHLSHLSEAIHGKSNDMATSWFKKYRSIMKNSQLGIEKMIRSAGYYIKKNNLSKTRSEQAKKQINYFLRHILYMNYAKYLMNGWPIGSGIIEAACKSIVKQRMCRSGQRWSLEGGQAILNLRTIVKSDRWDNFWNEYKNLAYMAA